MASFSETYNNIDKYIEIHVGLDHVAKHVVFLELEVVD